MMTSFLLLLGGEPNLISHPIRFVVVFDPKKHFKLEKRKKLIVCQQKYRFAKWFKFKCSQYNTELPSCYYY